MSGDGGMFSSIGSMFGGGGGGGALDSMGGTFTDAFGTTFSGGPGTLESLGTATDWTGGSATDVFGNMFSGPGSQLFADSLGTAAAPGGPLGGAQGKNGALDLESLAKKAMSLGGAAGGLANLLGGNKNELPTPPAFPAYTPLAVTDPLTQLLPAAGDDDAEYWLQKVLSSMKDEER